MQIKLIQTEIEEAIRNYIQEQVTVKEGMEINIDLSATRGPEGFIANVEIVKANGAQATKVTAQAQPAETAQAEPTPVRATRAARPAIAPRQATEIVAESADTVSAAVDQGVPEEAAVAAPEGEAEAPAPAGRSLFGNLPAPTNK